MRRRALTTKDSYDPVKLNRFAEEYLLDLDPAQAALRVGLPEHHGARILARPDVQTKVRLARLRRQSHTEIYADAVLRRWWQLATADAREITSVHRVNCRHCHGHDHRYQFTVDELRTARQRHEIAQRELPPGTGTPFDDLGGDGFDVWGDPDPECTECGGKGLPQVWVADMRQLSPGAVLLYDGVDVSRDGTIRVKHRDRNWADQMVAGHLGISVKGNSREPTPLDPAQMSDEQLEVTIAAFKRVGIIDEEVEELERVE
jgi:phage terminase small subunit